MDAFKLNVAIHIRCKYWLVSMRSICITFHIHSKVLYWFVCTCLVVLQHYTNQQNIFFFVLFSFKDFVAVLKLFQKIVCSTKWKLKFYLNEAVVKMWTSSCCVRLEKAYVLAKFNKAKVCVLAIEEHVWVDAMN